MTRSTASISRVAAVAAAAVSIPLLLAGLQAEPNRKAPAAAKAAAKKDFRLKDTTGTMRSLADYKDRKAIVLVFVGTTCPIANSYVQDLVAMEKAYRDRGVQFLAVNANSHEAMGEVVKHAQEYGYSFPVLKDDKQAVADMLGAKVTPESFILDAQGNVLYRGRIDDRYASRTKRRPNVTSHDLKDALEQVLGGKPVTVASQAPFGCQITRPEKNTANAGGVTFYNQISRIMQKNCESCHRPGEVGPMTLQTYEDVKSWAQEIKYVTQKRTMPPWKAERGYAEFHDQRHLSDEEVTTLAKWVDAGAPAGDPKQAPAKVKYADGWQLGTPDLVLSMGDEFTVPANGDDIYQCFVIPGGLLEDKNVTGLEVRPGNAKAVHHVLVFLDKSGQARKLDAKDPAPGYRSFGGVGFLPTGGLGGWAPGNMPRFTPEGTARPMEKASDVILQVHYHPTGKEEKDKTRIGLYFAKKPVEKVYRTFPLGQWFINIPPGAERHKMTASMTVPADVQAHGITPHMHLLGREMKMWATLPNGKVEPLIWIKDWDFNWQDNYVFKQPISLPKGTKVELEAYYDNSTKNPNNPNNPPKTVRFGEGTADEMCIGFIQYTLDKETGGKGLPFFFGQNLRSQPLIASRF